MKNVKTLARDIKADASDYPLEVRDEVLEELARITIREEELSSAEASALYDLLR
jgi:hypothetical protein